MIHFQHETVRSLNLLKRDSSFLLDPFELQPALITLFHQSTVISDDTLTDNTTSTTMAETKTSKEEGGGGGVKREGEIENQASAASVHLKKEEAKQKLWIDHFDKFGRGATMYRTLGKLQIRRICFKANGFCRVDLTEKKTRCNEDRNL